MIEATTPYWLADHGVSASSTDLPGHADIAVVGGGLVGTATAYWLARAGARPVLLERAALASGTTGRNGGLIVTGGPGGYPFVAARVGAHTAKLTWQFTVDNHELMHEVFDAEGIGPLAGYRPAGHLHIAASEGAAQAGHLIAEALAADGFDATLLDRAQLAELIGTPVADHVPGGLFQPRSATIHPVRLIVGLARAAVRHGARIVEHAETTGIEPGADGVLLHGPRGTLTADRVVVAAGVWSPRLIPELTGLITPQRGEILAYAPSARVFHTACTTDAADGGYWHQAPDGAIVVGGGDAPTAGRPFDIADGGTAPMPTAACQTTIEQLLPAIFPDLPLPAVRNRWAGWLDGTADGLPLAGQANELPGCWFACGFNGHGMPFGLRMGQLLAEAATTGTTPQAMAPFQLNRSR